LKELQEASTDCTASALVGDMIGIDSWKGSAMLQDEGSSQYLTIWEFHVRAGCESQFEAVYGPNGEWVQLFAQAHGFIKTELNHDLNDPLHYLTLDYWSSKEAYEIFREQYRTEYAVLDQRCEGLTEQETALGVFERVDAESRR